MGEPEPVVKLNKDTLEAALVQIEYLKGAKKDQIALLCKLFDGKITADDLEEFEKIFKSLDTEETNEMPVSELANVLRILQQMPTEEDIVKLLEIINPKKSEQEKAKEKKNDKKKDDKGKGENSEETPEEEKIDFFKFLHGLALYFRDPLEIADEIKKAFKVLDRSKQGYIMLADLRDFLTKLGDGLTDEELDEMIKLGDTESASRINYEEFIDLMTSMKPGGKKKGKKGKKGKKKGKKK